MPKAVWNGAVLAESDQTQQVWVADNEAEVVLTAMNYLRTMYDVKQR